MRSVEEIDADIAEVQKRIAARNEGTPQRNSPEYRAARFDYIVDGDRSGLDAYQNALNAAIQNKLSRESQERLLKEGKEKADDEQMDQWQKDYSFAKSAKEEIDNNPKSTQKQKDDAAATVRYYEAVGAKKGYMKKYADMTKAPEAPKVETPASNVKPARSYEQIMGDVDKLIGTEGPVDPALIDKLSEELLDYRGSDFTTRETNTALAKLENKKKSDSDKAGSDSMGKDAEALKGALATGNADKIDAAATAYEKHKGKTGYSDESVVNARKKAQGIRNSAAEAKNLAEAAKLVTLGELRAAAYKQRNEKSDANRYVTKKYNGKEYKIKYKFDENDNASVFYNKTWHPVK
jgi:hypothetical protein